MLKAEFMKKQGSKDRPPGRQVKRGNLKPMYINNFSSISLNFILERDTFCLQKQPWPCNSLPDLYNKKWFLATQKLFNSTQIQNFHEDFSVDSKQYMTLRASFSF